MHVNGRCLDWKARDVVMLGDSRFTARETDFAARESNFLQRHLESSVERVVGCGSSAHNLLELALEQT